MVCTTSGTTNQAPKPSRTSTETNAHVVHAFLVQLLLLLLAQVTYNQVQPLRINYLASSHRGIKALIVCSIKIV